MHANTAVNRHAGRYKDSYVPCLQGRPASDRGSFLSLEIGSARWLRSPISRWVYGHSALMIRL